MAMQEFSSMFIRNLTTTALILLLALPAFGGDRTGAGDCAFAHGSGEFRPFANCLERDTAGRLFVSRKLIKKLLFQENSLAEVYSPEHGWMYVNRKGQVIIQGVAAMDNGADRFNDGLVRFSTKGKWGFADVAGHAVIPPSYDGALNYDKGIARVCVGCKDACVDRNCEYHQFEGGKWLCLDTAGKEVNCPFSP